MKRILLIEDQLSERDLIRRFFQSVPALSGITELVECETFAEGLERANTGDVDVVLLDLNFPDSGKADTVLRIGEFLPPVVIITGWIDEHLREQCFLHGAYYFIEKTGATHGILNACHNAWLFRKFNPR